MSGDPLFPAAPGDPVFTPVSLTPRPLHLWPDHPAPGRVYDVRPDPAKGERDGRRLRVVHLARDGRTGEPGAKGQLRSVTRVAFDADADEGPAAVTAFVTDAGGSFVTSPDGPELARTTFRATVRVERIEPPRAATADAAADAPAVVTR